MIIAYARVSTTEQDPTMQVDAIRKQYPDALVHEERASASSREGRPRLEAILQTIRDGDSLVVWKLDRLARNVLDLLKIVEELENKGAGLIVLDQKIDTSTAAGKCFLQMLGVFAEFETSLRYERQMAGIAKAKAEGKYKGRPATIDKDRISEMLADGMSHAVIAKKIGCSTKSIQRVRREIEAKGTTWQSGVKDAEARRLEEASLDH
jgi:Site-specific recombinases, DNA invertase Pin homologs